MISVSTDQIARWRERQIGRIAFIVGFASVASGAIYLCVDVFVPAHAWEAIARCVFWTLQFGLLAGWGLWKVTVALLRRWHYSHGFYHCVACGRTLGSGIDCECLDHETRELLRRPSGWWRQHWQKYRDQIPWVLGAYALVFPFAAAFAARQVQLFHEPYLGSLILSFAVLGVLLGFAVEGVSIVLELFKTTHELGARLEVFLRVYVLPLVVLLFVGFGLIHRG